MRRRFLVRIAGALTLFVLAIIVIPLFVAWNLLSAAGVDSPGRAVLAVGALALLIVILGAAGSGARRYAVPLGDLVESAGRVEAGDYSARVAEPRHVQHELRALAHAFNNMTARLEADAKQRRTLLADVSHELRTPLAVLQGELEAMIDGVHPADEAHLAIALEEIRMLGQLVEDLRTLTEAEAGTLALHREPTDLAVLAQEVATAFEGLAGPARVKIRVEMPDDLPLLDVDPLRIRQVLVNIVSNALRYAPAGSAVRIVGQRTKTGVTVSVVDLGPGVAPELLPHLFERFAKSAESRGSGLGLAIARRLVEAHGGAIGAETGRGRGSDAGGTAPETAGPGTTGPGTTIRFELPA
jgi:two-component system sensor histidine kinase BaeS